jgi:hypothetical protein
VRKRLISKLIGKCKKKYTDENDRDYLSWYILWQLQMQIKVLEEEGSEKWLEGS